MALGHTANAGKVMDCNALPLLVEAIWAHTVSGLQNNLGSVSQLVNAGYVPIFN